MSHMGFSELEQKHPEHAKEFEKCRVYFTDAWESVMQGARSLSRRPSP